MSRALADDAGTIIQALRSLADAGALRRLDLAFAQFVHELDDKPGLALPVAAALLSRLESLGHTSLPILALVDADHARFAWPAGTRDQIAQLWQRLPDNVDAWQSQLGASTTVLRADHDEDRGQPLVMVGKDGSAALYLRRFWRDEQTIRTAVQARCITDESVDLPLTRGWLDRLFESGGTVDSGRDKQYSPPDDSSVGTADWQKIACALAVRGRFTVITGGPGTGKTYTAARLLALLFAISPAPEQLRIALAAPTGKAAARLRQSIDASLQSLQGRLGAHLNLAELTRRLGGATTLHALLGSRPDSRQFHHHEGNPLDVDVVIVDEASMIHLEMMAALTRALPPQARLVLLGDKDQLASVEAGAVLGDLCRDAQAGRYSEATSVYVQASSGECIPHAYRADQTDPSPLLAQQTVMLRQSRRFSGPIGTLAQAVNAGDAQRTVEQFAASDASSPLWAAIGASPALVCSIAAHGRGGATDSYRDYLLKLSDRPGASGKADHERWAREILQSFDRFRILSAVREGPWGVAGLNQGIEQTLAQEGLIETQGAWYAGRPVMVTRNNPTLKVFNGDVGIALPSPEGDGRLRVYFLDGEKVRSVSVTRLTQVETAYAMTVHKSQGSEFSHTVLVLPVRAASVLTRELFYTGITRARTAFTLIAEKSGLLEAAVARATQRASAWQGAGQGQHETGRDIAN